MSKEKTTSLEITRFPYIEEYIIKSAKIYCVLSNVVADYWKNRDGSYKEIEYIPDLGKDYDGLEEYEKRILKLK